MPNTNEAHIVCVWCGAEWSDENLKLYNLDAGDHCASGRFYPECCSVEIVCHKCNKLMYQKDGVEINI